MTVNLSATIYYDNNMSFLTAPLREAGGKHNLPHIHAEYSGQEIAVALDGTILEGDFPKGKMKLLEAWMEIHHEELEANWTLISNGEQVFRVDPLK